jgi:lipid A 3-O-deacylase
MRSFIFMAAVLLITCSTGFAQFDPPPGGTEVQIWAGGGHSVPGGTANTGAFNAGLRYGWILTDNHLPGILRGSFEYAVDAVPVFLVFQPANTAYGAGFDPLGLKWNFERRVGRRAGRRLAPYVELTGGVLFTNHNVPANTNTVNFMDQAALGTRIGGAKHHWSVELRYMHISNAGLGNLNPGINTLQVRLGLGWFYGGHLE